MIEEVMSNLIIEAVKAFGGRRHDETYAEALIRYSQEIPVELKRLKSEIANFRAMAADAKWGLTP